MLKMGSIGRGNSQNGADQVTVISYGKSIVPVKIIAQEWKAGAYVVRIRLSQ
jgi:hypothetical protein